MEKVNQVQTGEKTGKAAATLYHVSELKDEILDCLKDIYNGEMDEQDIEQLFDRDFGRSFRLIEKGMKKHISESVAASMQYDKRNGSLAI